MIPQYMYLDLKAKAKNRLQEAVAKVSAKYADKIKQVAQQVIDECDERDVCSIELGHYMQYDSMTGNSEPHYYVDIRTDSKVKQEIDDAIREALQPILDKRATETQPLVKIYDDWELKLISAANASEITLPKF